MKKILLTLSIALGLTSLTKAQLITCLPCDQLGMSVNVGSDTNALNIYHAGQYLTHPQEHNIFSWEFMDSQGNIIFKDTIVDYAFVSFSHSFPITDTMNVTVYLRNDSAILLDGNIVNCIFEDQIYWETGVYSTGTPWGRWAFIHGNVGVDLNVVSSVNHVFSSNKELIKIVNLLGIETVFKTNALLFYIYSDGTTKKKYYSE